MNSLRIPTYWHALLPLLLLPYAGQIKFISKYDGKTVTGLVGSSVNFTWSFSGDVDSVSWGLKKDGVDIIKNELVCLDKSGPVPLAVPSSYSGRVSGSSDASFSQVTFTLSSIRMSDKGFYGCKITPSDIFYEEKFDSVYLAVKEAPQISISSVQASYNEGSSVNIGCTASGTPDPDVQWTKNGNEKNTGNKTVFLTFNSINREDDGQYTCKANNSAGNDEKHVMLVVHYKPEGTTLTGSTAANTVTQGRSVTFTCHATAAKPKVSTYRFSLNDTTLVKDSNDNQYTINNAQRSQHYGKYKCVPRNDVGDGPEAAVILNVNVPVQFTTFPQNLIVNETSPLVLKCDASGFPEPSFTWTKDGQGLSHSKQLNIQRSQRSDAGMYVCTASNGVGQDKTANNYITVQYPPAIKAVTTSINKSWIGQTIRLTCKSDGVPTPTLTWNKPDGSQIKSVTATQNTVSVKMSVDEDFGDYKCDADNGLTPADFKIVKIEQIRPPC